ncbi:hypothetical protein LR392_03045 [Arthrobacter sp. AK04]|uniref:hypothetical protein n=1 Tax=Arthrobacter sp. AK04 TaxID=2900048 RepID=UPI001E509C18|nr:hypothetical protein [Arthrobacter sp. AK04]MCD5341203.1 hypothetical protein [Arthrobacter sp. AK04]
MTEKGHGQDDAESSARKLNAGLLALLILVLNTAGVFWAVWAAGDGVDSGIGLVYFLLTVTFPAALATIALGVVSLVRRRGRVPGTIALSISSGVLIWFVYGFLESQVF